MKNKSIRTTFIIIFIVVISILFFFVFIILNRLQTLRNYNKTVRSFISLNSKFKDYIENQYSFFINYSKDPIFFRTEQNDYIRKDELLFNDLKNDIQVLYNNPMFDQLELEKISQIKSQLDIINSYFRDIKHKLYLRGNLSLKSGYIGKIQEFYFSLKDQAPNKQITVLIDSLYKDFLFYLTSGDDYYYKVFLEDFTKINQLIQSKSIRDTASLDTTIIVPPEQANSFLGIFNDFKNYFRDLVQLDKEIGFVGNKGLLTAWAETVNSTNTHFNNIKKSLLPETGNFLNRFIFVSIISSIFIFLVLIVILISNFRIFKYSYAQVYDFIKPLRLGQIPQKIDIKVQNEIGDILSILNIYIDSLHRTIRFTQALGQGRYDIEFKPLSDKDALANALLQLREDLIKSKEEEEKRKEEEKIRQWTNEGISKFSELLRQYSQDINTLAKITIKNLVNYLNANQGAFFILEEIDDLETNETKRYLELVATYAYSKERKKEKRFLLGEGLVGTVALEGETTYLTDIPEDYISITSGLGEANPRSLLIVPLKHEDILVGVVEIASFNLIKDYEISFVEQVGESIAATLSLTKINERNQRLLEQFQMQAKEMASKEEEMRQNLEELRATQEEAARREAQLQSLINAIEAAGFVTTLDINGFIVRVNKRLLEHLGISHYDIVGHHISEFDMEGKLMDENIFEDVKEGNTKHYVRHFIVNNKEYWFDEYYAPLKDPKGNISQIILISVDITENILKAKELEEKARKQEKAEIKLRIEMAELEEARKQLEKQRDEAQKRLKELIDKQNELNKALELAKERERDYEKMLREVNKERGELKDIMEDMSANREILEREHKILEQKEKELKERLYESTRQLTKKDNRIKGLEKKVKELEDKVKELEEKIERMKRNKK